MKLPYLFIPVGIAIGYGIGNIRGLEGMDLIWEMFYGFGVGYSAYRVWSENSYAILVGMILGLIAALSIDWLAGSAPDLQNKLSFMFLGSFIGWLFYEYWREILLGGLIAMTIGFIWGLNDSHWFGTVCLPAGILNASLLGTQISIIGMALAGLVVGFLGPLFEGSRRHLLLK
jgi:uncharacterized membrane protein